MCLLREKNADYVSSHYTVQSGFCVVHVLLCCAACLFTPIPSLLFRTVPSCVSLFPGCRSMKGRRSS